MIDPVLLEFWSTAVDVELQVKELGHERLAAAQQFLRTLTELNHEDQIRGALSSELHDGDAEMQRTGRRLIDDLSLLLLRGAASSARAEGSGAQGRVNTSWLSLVSEFGSRSNLFRAHAALLEGFILDRDNQSTDARQAFENARHAYRYEEDSGSTEAALVCSCALASLAAEHGDFEDAEKATVATLAEAERLDRKNRGWKDYLRQVLAVERDRLDTLESLILAVTPDELRERALNRPAARERRMVELVGLRAVHAAARDTHEEAIRLATIGDWLAESQGTSADLRRRLGDFLATRGHYNTSEQLFALLHAEAPDDVLIIKKLAQTRLSQGRYADAQQLLMALARRSTDDPEVLGLLAASLLHLGQLDQARVCAAAALRLDGSQQLAKKILDLTGSPSESGPEVVLKQDTKELIISEEALANPERAAELISAAIIRANPADAPSLLESISREKGVDVARRIAMMALGPAAPPIGTDHLAQAESLFAARRLPEALAEYRLAIRDNPDAAGAYLGAGDCHYFMGQPYLAAAFFEESTAIAPAAPTLLFLGNAYAKCGRLSQAMRAYERALEIDPSYAHAHRRLEVVQKQMTESSR